VSAKIPFPLVLIEWEDHWGDGKWVSPDKMEMKPELCLTVGWLVKEDEKGVMLASCIDPKDPETGAMGSTQYVVKSCIVSQKVLRKGKSTKAIVHRVERPLGSE